MQIQVNTDDHIVGRIELAESVRDQVAAALDRFGDRITRVEVHLRDANARKAGGRDKECTIEARLTGRDPIAVSEAADSLGQAITGAAEKIERLIESSLGRIRDSRGRESIRHRQRPSVPGSPPTDGDATDPRGGTAS